MSRGKLVIISGPSGTGKGTICNELFKDSQNVFSISMTTRAPREGEAHGVNYYFVEKEEFEDMIKNDGLLEYAQVFENYYGTPKKYVFEQLDEGKNVILEIDVQGALQIKKKHPDALFVFILPPSLKVLRDRIVGRGTETEESIKLRLGEAVTEIMQADQYNYTVVNDVLEDAVDDVKAIIRAERNKVDDNISELLNKYKEEE